MVGIFRNTSAVTRKFGVRPLEAEKALNLSGGITSKISPRINLTLDAYWIQLKNRIVLSGRFDKSNPDASRILAGLPGIDEARFVTNAVNTRTVGLDMVVNGKWKFRKHEIGIMLAANFSRTNICGAVRLADSLRKDTINSNTLFNREERSKMENGQPGSKIIMSANYKIGKMAVLLRATRFGNTSAVFSSLDSSRDEFFSAKVLTDLHLIYSPKAWLTITCGANNLFDVYPDRLKNYLNRTEGILIYSNEAMPFGYNGGYYFVSMGLKF
jgi:iron complex outermembrane receptor protein